MKIKLHKELNMRTTIPTEQIGNIPRPTDLIARATKVPIGQLGATDDCGFSPFSDDTSTTCGTAFAKIEARVLGTRLAEKIWEVDSAR